MIEANKLREQKSSYLDELEKALMELTPEERYHGQLARKEECTVSDIVKMVREGQPINGITHSFAEDDDQDGSNDSDDKDYIVHEKIVEQYRYFDDDLVMLNELSERERAARAAEIAKQQPTPESTPEPTPESTPESTPE